MWVKVLRQVVAVTWVGVCFVGSLLADNRPELPDLTELLPTRISSCSMVGDA